MRRGSQRHWEHYCRLKPPSSSPTPQRQRHQGLWVKISSAKQRGMYRSVHQDKQFVSNVTSKQCVVTTLELCTLTNALSLSILSPLFTLSFSHSSLIFILSLSDPVPLTLPLLVSHFTLSHFTFFFPSLCLFDSSCFILSLSLTLSPCL